MDPIPMLAGPIGLLVILGALAAAAALIKRARGTSGRREEQPSAGDPASPIDHSFGPSREGGSHQDHHLHSVPDGDGDPSESDSDSFAGGQDGEASSSDSADTGGSDSPSSDD